MIDIDGVLADLSPHDEVLRDADIPAVQRWREFFAHIPDAAVIEAGHDLASAIESLGYTLVYSTTRPAYTRAATRLWLADRDFPAGRALLTRPTTEFAQHPQTAWRIKRAHTRAVTNRQPAWLRAFIDDDADDLARLASEGIPVHDAAALRTLGVSALRTHLDHPKTTTTGGPAEHTTTGRSRRTR